MGRGQGRTVAGHRRGRVTAAAGPVTHVRRRRLSGGVPERRLIRTAVRGVPAAAVDRTIVKRGGYPAAAALSAR